VHDPRTSSRIAPRPGLSRVRRSALIGCAVGLAAVAAAPMALDTYMINILIRALFLAAVAMTVDILWGYVGILTFGQSAFFGIGAYACGLIFTHYGFGPDWALGALAPGWPSPRWLRWRRGGWRSSTAPRRSTARSSRWRCRSC
jgi:hypothetical protein